MRKILLFLIISLCIGCTQIPLSAPMPDSARPQESIQLSIPQSCTALPSTKSFDSYREPGQIPSWSPGVNWEWSLEQTSSALHFNYHYHVIMHPRWLDFELNLTPLTLHYYSDGDANCDALIPQTDYENFIAGLRCFQRELSSYATSALSNHSKELIPARNCLDDILSQVPNTVGRSALNGTYCPSYGSYC